MNELKLALKDNQTSFRHGDAIAGAAGWKLDQTPKSIEIHLFWRTEGKGSDDVGIVESMTFENPQKEEARPFSFQAPDAPSSFSGRLISLIWGLEMVVKPGTEACRLDLVLSPTGREIELDRHEGAA